MLLKYIDLYLNLEQYPSELATPFGFKTRYICNFLERRIRPLKYDTDGFSKICVQGNRVPEQSCPIVSETAAVPSVAFDEERYRVLENDEIHEFLIAMLVEGLEKCARHHRIPLAQMQDAIEDFRSRGYTNEWVHRKKLLRGTGLRAYLLCSLDIEKFTLTLRLERNGRTVFEEPILQTKPDETIFAYRFKDVVLNENTVIVTGKFGDPTFTLDIGTLE